MGYDSAEPISEGLYPRGFRKTLALMLFFVTTTMPTVFLWQNPPDAPAAAEPGHLGTFDLFPSQSGHFGHRHSSYQPVSSGNTWWWLFCSFVQLTLATFGGLFSLALYYPRSGFKRFAFLCGPLVGLGTMFTLGLYLAARSEVYRFEICLASLFGAAPGLALYVLLVSWKANRLADQALPMPAAYAGEPIYQADPIGSPMGHNGQSNPQYPRSTHWRA